MKKLLFVICVSISCTSRSQSSAPQLWYKKPASVWTEALPVGNGRLGGMVFGDYKLEHIQLNEESVWAGSKINNNNPGALTHMGEVQDAIFKGAYKQALELSNKYLVGTPPRIRSYQTLGNLFIQYHWQAEPDVYKRSLNLQTGIATTAYTVAGNKIVQRVYVSAPQDVMMVSITAEQPFDAKIFVSREFNVNNENYGRKKWVFPVKTFYRNQYQSSNVMASYTGQIIDTATKGMGPAGDHMRYATAIKIISVDGKTTGFKSDTAAGFDLQHVKSIVLMLTGATDYNFDKLDTDSSIDPLLVCKKIIEKASVNDVAALQRKHIAEHRSLFDRITFSLGKDNNEQLATNERLDAMKTGKTDNGLLALYYQFGRYLLMSSSRKPGRLPANLQGIWNDLYDVAWSSDFHTNINLQMNYWPAESANLSETVLPLANFITNLSVPGAVTAKEMYGARGWTLHHLTDAYGRTGVSDGVWGITPTDGAWMTFPLYDHFEFTGDTAFLKKTVYPLMKGSVEFLLDILIKSPEGYLVINPSHSPENSFWVPGTNRKEKTQMTYGPAVDGEILNELFNKFSEVSGILHMDSELLVKMKAAQKLFPPIKIAPNGTIQEWIQDFDEVDPGHRHMAHLLGLYPLNSITPKDTILFEGAKKTLERRLANGAGHQGWSKAWIINLYARLLEPEKAIDNLNDLLRKSTLPNLFDTHPPFQIDGNFGGTAAIAEMILQSQGNELNLLPAVPAQWPDGSMHGIKGRGACIINLDWQNGQLVKVVVRSEKGGVYNLRYKGIKKTIKLAKGHALTLNGNLKING